jgi:hypothetical protein
MIKESRSKLNEVGAGRFLPVGGAIIEACEIVQCEKIRESIESKIT